MVGLKKQFGFMDLPGELRNKVYSFAIPNGKAHFIRHEPGILRASKQIRNECLPLFYGRMNCFEYNPQHFSKLRLFAVSEAASYLQHIGIDFEVTLDGAYDRFYDPPPIKCCIDAHLHDDYLTFEFFEHYSHGFMKRTKSLTLLKHGTFVDMEPWAKANFKKKLTGYDLFAAIDRIGNSRIEKVQRLTDEDRQLGYAWLSCDGWERHPRYEPSDSFREFSIWVMDQKLSLLRARGRRVHAVQ